jgi:hypothetical protein
LLTLKPIGESSQIEEVAELQDGTIKIKFSKTRLSFLQPSTSRPQITRSFGTWFIPKHLKGVDFTKEIAQAQYEYVRIGSNSPTYTQMEQLEVHQQD